MYCSIQRGIISQETNGLFLSSLYANAKRLPLHYYTNDSQTIQIRTDSDELIGVCTIFTSAAFPDYLILGNYECIDEAKVATMLFTEIEKQAKASSKRLLLGPMNRNTWHSYRFSLQQQTPFLFEHIHKSYYPQQWMNYGFEVRANYHTNIETVRRETELEQTDFFELKKLKVRSFDLENAQADLQKMYALSMQSFKHNLFFESIGWENFYALYENLLPFIKPQFIDMVFDADHLVGFLFAQPDSYETNRLIVKTMARHPGRDYAGMGRALRNRVRHKCKQYGYDTMIHAYIYEENYSNVLSHNVGSRLYQHHALFCKRL